MSSETISDATLKLMLDNAVHTMAKQQGALIGAIMSAQPDVKEVMLAGGYFKEMHQKECDLDLFTEDKWGDVEGAHKTPNAQSFELRDRKIQLCNYKKGSLKALVDSFDFSYCQCGVVFEPGNWVEWEVKEIYYTEAWCAWWINRKMTFEGSEYPVSSLVRAGKLYKKGLISSFQHINLVLDCLHAVAVRGFKDRADLRDQLDSVDLQYVDDKDGGRHYRLLDVLPGKKEEA